jgi:3-oxoacyl-[acyl-carrier-protein] synthase II
VANESRPADLRHALSNSFGFGGANATILLSRS